MLTHLGLTLAEQDLYRHLIRHSPVPVADLAVTHGEAVPVTMERLIALGLVVRLPGPPELIAVVPPRAALEPLLHARAGQLAEIRGRLAARAARADDAAAQRELNPPVELLPGPEAMVRARRELMLSVRSTLRTWDMPPYLDDMEWALPIEDDYRERGVMVRVLYDPSAVSAPGRLAELLGDVLSGFYARVAELPMKAAIADQSLALVAKVVDDHVEGLLIRDPVLIRALTAAFEWYWEIGIPLGAFTAERLAADAAASGQVPAEPDDRERELLLLLVAGLTDREIAARLGLNERTVRGRIQRIKIRLGARTRYQAGYLAARYGWLTPMRPATFRRAGDGGATNAAA
ncbi:LuxR C-terminal-related transcriptional regulator [Micromonospora rubida]|uniref:LuxR C-terminal-related transcriptional regulator n=1 Tax=Micromonospora rubida TaxID=2697657 RepID=A0ABW7SR80_9ACTN